MEVQALVEREVELFCMVKERLASKLKAPISVEIQVAVFTSVHNWQMNKAIDAQQTERYQSRQPAQAAAGGSTERRSSAGSGERQPKPRSDVHCVDCDRLLTIGEKKYCDDADKQYRCYQCTKSRE